MEALSNQIMIPKRTDTFAFYASIPGAFSSPPMHKDDADIEAVYLSVPMIQKSRYFADNSSLAVPSFDEDPPVNYSFVSDGAVADSTAFTSSLTFDAFKESQVVSKYVATLSEEYICALRNGAMEKSQFRGLVAISDNALSGELSEPVESQLWIEDPRKCLTQIVPSSSSAVKEAIASDREHMFDILSSSSIALKYEHSRPLSPHFNCKCLAVYKEQYVKISTKFLINEQPSATSFPYDSVLIQVSLSPLFSNAPGQSATRYEVSGGVQLSPSNGSFNASSKVLSWQYKPPVNTSLGRAISLTFDAKLQLTPVHDSSSRTVSSEQEAPHYMTITRFPVIVKAHAESSKLTTGIKAYILNKASPQDPPVTAKFNSKLEYRFYV